MTPHARSRGFTGALTRTRTRRNLCGFVGIVVFIAIWKLAASSGLMRPGAIPDPFKVPGAFLAEWQSHRLLPALGSSLIHYVWGLCAGTVLGIAFGAATALSRSLQAATAWIVQMLRPIPPLAWVVFAIAWFQVSQEAAAFIITIGVFWINYFTTYAGVRGVDPKYDELAQAFGRNGFRPKLAGITLPAAAPGILAGVRAGVGDAWMILIAAELVGMPGMGQEMEAAAGVGAYAAVVVYMLVISAVYTLWDAGFLQLEKRLLRWRPS